MPSPSISPHSTKASAKKTRTLANWKYIGPRAAASPQGSKPFQLHTVTGADGDDNRRPCSPEQRAVARVPSSRLGAGADRSRSPLTRREFRGYPSRGAPGLAAPEGKSMRNTIPLLTGALVLLASFAPPAGAAQQMVRGRVFVVTDPLPGVNSSRRHILVYGAELPSTSTVVGDPRSDGAQLLVVAKGNTSASQ